MARHLRKILSTKKTFIPFMRVLIIFFSLLFTMQSCGNDSSENTVEQDPSSVHPPSEAIPDSTKLVNDSVIVPDTVPEKSQVGGSDSLQKNK